MIPARSLAADQTARPVGKSPAAFRTIAEVAAQLDLPPHVLRFWESKFPQIKPLKRRGGRRYYRPEDVALLHRIRTLLYTEGYTIRGVQRLLREGAGPGGSQPASPAALDPAADVSPSASAEGEEEAAAARDPNNPAGMFAEDETVLRALLSELLALRALLPEAGD